MDSGVRELGHSICGVLLPSPGKQDRPLSVLSGAIKDYPGSDYADCIFRIFYFISEGRPEMELYCWFFYDNRRSDIHI
jgi:hypothetical protein